MAASSSTSSSEPRRFPWAAVVAALLIVVGEAAIFRYREAFTWALFQTVLDKRAIMEDRQAEDVVIAGDSRLFHVRPEVVAEALGPDVRVVNYSWPFFGTEAYEYFLNGYMSRKAPPRALIVNFPVSIMAQPEEQIHRSRNPLVTNRMFLFLPPGALLRDLARDRNWGTLWDYVKFLATPPSLKYRDRLCKHLRFLRDQGTVAAFDAEDQRRVDEFRAGGAFRIYLTQRFNPEKDVAEFEKFYGPIRPGQSPAAMATFERFLERTGELGIPVLIMNSPDSEALRRLWKDRGVLPVFEETVAGWQRRWPHLMVAEPVASSLPDGGFGDPAHVNAEGEELHRKMYRSQLEALRGELRRRMGL